MKKLLLSLLLLINSAMAQDIEVIVGIPAGNFVDLLCRNVMESYDTLYGTKSVVINVPGGDQTIGHKHFINSNKSKLFCGGSSPAGLNQKLFPNTSPSSDTIRPIVAMLNMSQFVYTPVGHPDTVAGLIKRSKETGKSVLVGGFSNNSTKLFSMYLEKHNVKYEIVLYKNPAESLISLREGNLDVYVDAGTIKPTLDQYPYVKEIAHIGSGNKRSNSENLYNKLLPHSAGLTVATVIYGKSDMSDSEAQQLNMQLNNAIKSENTQNFFKTRVPFHTPINSTVKDVENRLKNTREYLDKYYVHN